MLTKRSPGQAGDRWRDRNNWGVLQCNRDKFIVSKVDHRFGEWYEGRSIGHLNSPPSGSFLVDDVLSEGSLGSCASGSYKKRRLSEVDMKPQRTHHLQEMCEKPGEVMHVLFGFYKPLTQGVVCEGGRLFMGARKGRPKLMQDGSGDGNPKKSGQFTSLANSSGGGHFGFGKVVVYVVGRGIVQGDYRRNELRGGLESTKGLNQSLSVNSVEGLFEVKAKCSPTNAEVLLCSGFNPRAQCESARGRFVNDVIIFAQPGVDPGKRISDVSLRKIGKLRHPCKLGPNMLEEAIADDGRKGFRSWAHQANRSKSSREDSVRGGMLCICLLEQGRNKVSTNAPGCGWCNPWGDRLANLGDAQFLLHFFKGKN
ncbi:hypothetical protein AK812_SmicGene12102 [Symbiodinium microadriaticum]|uniref:Uncharacterized protein n=1 Tax=Symbiodinium microadriaticum TaxID=2951 RepID=A0A1Q9EBR2_SYMMI|nr:hypothetical protein AK812_SmicGene12102 [Symbiodinium microadriaticum]